MKLSTRFAAGSARSPTASASSLSVPSPPETQQTAAAASCGLFAKMLFYGLVAAAIPLLFFYESHSNTSSPVTLSPSTQDSINLPISIDKTSTTNDFRKSSLSAADGKKTSKSSLSKPTPVIHSIHSPTKTDLVIGMAQNVDPYYFAVFCNSLRETSSSVSIVLFINEPIPTIHAEIAKNASATLVSFNPESLAAFAKSYHPSTVRWKYMYDYLEPRQSKFNRVMVIDVRDSYFQSDPFAHFDPHLRGSAFYVYQDSNVNIKDCGWNSNWVKDCFGNDVLNHIGRQQIVCSGVSSGLLILF